MRFNQQKALVRVRQGVPRVKPIGQNVNALLDKQRVVAYFQHGRDIGLVQKPFKQGFVSRKEVNTWVQICKRVNGKLLYKLLILSAQNKVFNKGYSLVFVAGNNIKKSDCHTTGCKFELLCHCIIPPEFKIVIAENRSARHVI